MGAPIPCDFKYSPLSPVPIVEGAPPAPPPITTPYCVSCAEEADVVAES